MKQANQTYKRVCFLLDRTTLCCFDLVSKKNGLSKSKLLNKWITKTGNDLKEVAYPKNKLTYTYNFRTNWRIFEYLQNLSLKRKVSMGKVLRNIVIQNTEGG